MGIEPITYRLQGGCSAVELRRHHTAKTRQNPPARLHLPEQASYQDSRGASILAAAGGLSSAALCLRDHAR